MSSKEVLHSCENCGQTVLASDSECWHCGVKLRAGPIFQPTSKTKEETDAPVRSSLTSSDLTDDEAADRSSAIKEPTLQALFYAIMTAITAAALLIVIRSLGQQPRLTASFEIVDDQTAVLLNAPDGSFSLSLPADLIWYFPQEARGQGEEAAQMVDDPQFRTALQPLIERASDAELLLLAQAESGIMVLARSQRLGGLSVQDVLAYAGSTSFANSTIINTRRGVGQGRSDLAVLTVEQDNPQMTCRQHIIPTPQSIYMAALCTDVQDFEEQAPIFNAILDTLTIR